MEPARTNRYGLIFFLFFITYGYFFQGGGWNQNTRIYLTQAIIHQHTFAIDAYREDSRDPDFFEFVNTGDWAYHDGRYYTNKSPGLSFLAVPVFAGAEYLLKKIIPADPERQVLLSAYASTLVTVSAAGALLCVMIVHVLTAFFGFSLSSALLLACFFGFGTTAFSYSTTFYCHVPSAALTFLAFTLAMHVKHDPRCRRNLTTLLTGAAASLAVLVEPSTWLISACIFFYLLSFARGRRAALFFLLGGIPCALAQLYYNAACFGGVLASSYHFANEAVMVKINGSLFGMPSPRRFLELLVLPYRGLFVYSPVLLMLLPGAVLFARQKKWLPELLVCTGAALAIFFFITGFHAWHGGSAAGPRYLLPAYPFAFLLSVFAFRAVPRLFIACGSVSIIINLAITAITNEIPVDIANPLVDVIAAGILQGQVSINPVPFSNFAAYPIIYELADFTRWTLNFNAFNLGEILFPHHIASLVPLIGFWCLWAVIWICTKPAPSTAR